MGQLPSNLDHIDLGIINHLREDGRKSFTDISKSLEITVGTVRNRFNRLVENNILQVYGRINPQLFENIVYSKVLIELLPPKRLDKVVTEVMTYPEVTFFARLTGKFELELNAMCRNNEHLQDLVDNRISQIEGVGHTQIEFYVHVYKTAQPDLQIMLPPIKDEK